MQCHRHHCILQVEQQEEGEPVELIDTEALASAADAAFMLAVLAATGIASPHVPFNDSWAVRALHAAAQGGSPEANLALAHRYFMADGLPGSCQEGLRSCDSPTGRRSLCLQPSWMLHVPSCTLTCSSHVLLLSLVAQ